MDPDANLREQAELVGAHDPVSRDRRRELRIALAQWLNKGGHSPTWTNYPEAAKLFRHWARYRVTPEAFR